jgi:hypothetical protein
MIIISVNPIAAAMQIMNNNIFQEYPGLWQNNIIALLLISISFLAGATLRSWYLFNKQ